MLDIFLKKKPPTLALWILLFVFIGPWVMAYGLYSARNKFTFETVETGELLATPQPMQHLTFFDKAWLGKWQIIYITPLSSQNDLPLLSILKQVHTALGKANAKVEYQVLSLSDTPLSPGTIAIIDPRGWFIMRYHPPFDAHGLLKDIRRLVRYSHAS